MVTISERNDLRSFRRYGTTQFRYALTYVLITFGVLLFLNYYTSVTNLDMVSKNKESAMVEKAQLAAAEISNLDVINTTTVSEVIGRMGSLRVNRLIITDQSGLAVYDSFGDTTQLQYMFLPEIVTALQGNDVFTLRFYDGVLCSQAATPIMSYGVLNGCLYISELDADQGALIESLQRNILSTTIILECLVILFSIAFARTFSGRLKRIMDSMRIIREGDYSHKVSMGGNDELTMLGDEFNDLTERLQTSEHKRRQFVSDASHELKTPLASIKLLSDSILQNDMDMDTVREFVGDIGNEADRLNRMSQKLLSLSRVDGQTDQDCEIIYIAPTVERVIKMLSMIADKNRIHMEFSLIEDSPILILEDDLYQIIYNLVENGIKYNTPGGNLTLSLYRDEDNAILEVRDTGVGIPEDAISHVFERFYRVDKARSRRSGGSGLGLSIVRNMILRHKGEIRLESIVGEGSAFFVSFPIFDTEEESL